MRTRSALFPNSRGDSLKLVLAAAGGLTRQVRRQADVSVVTLGDLFGKS